MTFDYKTYIKHLPHTPGVYQMFDHTDQVIYVGKARSLKKRVASYFNGKAKDNKTMRLVRSISSIQYHVTRSESEALILENQLIKKHKPRYNVLLKDDKSYPYIYASVGKDEFPRIEFKRGKKNKSGQYFGPYPSAASVRQTLHFLQKTFKVRQCNNTTYSNRSRPCLQYQINRCSAPCVGLVSHKDYQKQLKYTFDFINGESEQVVNTLIDQMEQASNQQSFEQAAEIRDQIKAIRFIQSQQVVESDPQFNAEIMYFNKESGLYMATVGIVRNGQLLGFRNHTPKTPKDTPLTEFASAFLSIYGDQQTLSEQIISNVAPCDKDQLISALSEHQNKKITFITQPRGDKKKLLNLAKENNLNALRVKSSKYASWQKKWALWIDELDFKQPPERVECFDISHQMGEHTRASCVVFDQNGAKKTAYRQYIIDSITGGDDYAAMRQVIEKRLRSITKHQLGYPDVWLIDGGKGQVNQTINVLKEHQIDCISVIGVTKDDERTAGEERLYLAKTQQFLKPEKHGLLSLMVQHIRNEAHNHAINSQRKAFKKARQNSTLEEIPGIGKTRRNTLLKHFGGLQGLQKASWDDIKTIKGISDKVAKQVYNFFHPPQD